MFCTFFPESRSLDKEIYRHALTIQKPCAWWQEKFIQYQENMDKLLINLNEMNNSSTLQRAGGM